MWRLRVVGWVSGSATCQLSFIAITFACRSGGTAVSYAAM